MNENVEKLEYLIALKKTKKEPNAMERDDFFAAWTALVNDEQFSEQAEKFLYDGFTYCGARPFAVYMEKSDDQIATLNSLYQGKLYGENCASTCQLLFNLLAIALNDKNMDDKVIVTLIQRIPKALVNKEGKVYGQADRSLKKNFFDVLDPTARYPAFQRLAEAGLTETTFKNFVISIDEIVGKMDFSGFSKKCQANMASVSNWLHSKEKDGKSVSVIAEASAQNEEKEAVSAENSEQRTVQEHNVTVLQKDQDTADSDDLKNAETGHEKETDSKNAKDESQKAVEELLQRIEVLEREKCELRHELSSNEKKIHSLEETVKHLQFNLDGRDRRITELLDEVRTLRSKNADLEQQNKKSEEEAVKRAEMMEMLRRDRTKQSDETVKRIGAKLRTYYMDYKDALALEMSTELGENMRDQMGEIFKILSSAGVLLK